MKPQTPSRQNSNSRSYLPPRFFLALVTLVCIALPTATQANPQVGHPRQARVPGNRTGRPSGDGGSCVLPSITFSGVTIDTNCYPQAVCSPNLCAFQITNADGFNGTFPVESWSTPEEWCDDPPLGMSCPLGYSSGLMHWKAFCSSSDCSGNASQELDFRATILVVEVDGTWYIQAYNPSASPSFYP
jgi:hypothetical protein